MNIEVVAWALKMPLNCHSTCWSRHTSSPLISSILTWIMVFGETDRGRADFIMILYWIEIDTKPHYFMEYTRNKTNRNVKKSTWELGFASRCPQLPEESSLPFPGSFGNVPPLTQLYAFLPPSCRKP